MDTFNTGHIHREALLSLFERLNLDIPTKELLFFSDYILSTFPESNFRKIRHCDILSALKIPSKHKKSNKKHIFTLQISDLQCCKIMRFFPNLSIYLRIQFPTDTVSYESPLLSQDETQNLGLVSTHSVVVSKEKTVENELEMGGNGLVAWLCKNEKRSETQIIGKAFLPLEEIVDLAGNGGKINRILCIYTDFNPEIGSFPADIIGKIRCNLSYKCEDTYEAPGNASEVPWSRRVVTEVPLVQPSLVTFTVLSVTNLTRGIDYYLSEGAMLSFPLTAYLQISLFHEDSDLKQRLDDLVTRLERGNEELHFQQRFQLEMDLDAAVLDYIKRKSACCEMIVKTNNGELLFGTAIIQLFPMLLSDVDGEFPLLNQYGQYMGSLKLAFSLNKEDRSSGLQPSLPPPKSIEKQPIPPPLPATPPPVVLQTPSPPPQSYLKLLISIESGLRIGSFLLMQQPIYPYLKLIWKGKVVACSTPAQATTYPSWDFTHVLEVVSTEEVRDGAVTVEAFHRRGDGEEGRLGSTAVDLKPLMKTEEISGWYQVLHLEAPAGQLKIRIAAIQPSHKSTFLPTKKPANQLITTDDADLIALHTAKMQALVAATVTLQQKYRLAV